LTLNDEMARNDANKILFFISLSNSYFKKLSFSIKFKRTINLMKFEYT
jgi:hypothetical protein